MQGIGQRLRPVCVAFSYYTWPEKMAEMAEKKSVGGKPIEMSGLAREKIVGWKILGRIKWNW